MFSTILLKIFMAEIKRKIHVIGINSFEFEDLPLKLQTLFIETPNIAVPEQYLENILSWENGCSKEKQYFPSKSKQKLITWLKSQSKDVILVSRGDPLWFGIGRFL